MGEIEWIIGHVPLDEPECGFNGEKCTVSSSKHKDFLLTLLNLKKRKKYNSDFVNEKFKFKYWKYSC